MVSLLRPCMAATWVVIQPCMRDFMAHCTQGIQPECQAGHRPPPCSSIPYPIKRASRSLRSWWKAVHRHSSHPLPAGYTASSAWVTRYRGNGGAPLPSHPSAGLTNLLCNRFEVLTAVVSADTFDSLLCRQETGWFHNRPLAMDPSGFNGVEPGTLAGQWTDDHATATCTLDTLVMALSHAVKYPASFIHPVELFRYVGWVHSSTVVTFPASASSNGAYGYRTDFLHISLQCGPTIS
jgi:hypothetical protein